MGITDAVFNYSRAIKTSGFSQQLCSACLAYCWGMPAPASFGRSLQQQFAKHPEEEYKSPFEQAAEQEKNTSLLKYICKEKHYNSLKKAFLWGFAFN